MAEKVTIELPDDFLQQVRMVAAGTRRTTDEVLLDWVRRAGAEPILEQLPDEQILAVADSQLDPAQEEELSDLLERQQEGTLAAAERSRLEDLMHAYRQGLVRKAQALKVAVSRGLRPPLT
jgi:hypothetical protein